MALRRPGVRVPLGPLEDTSKEVSFFICWTAVEPFQGQVSASQRHPPFQGVNGQAGGSSPLEDPLTKVSVRVLFVLIQKAHLSPTGEW
jgi:hypothetical protein